MNRSETIQVLSVIKAAYPRFYQDIPIEEAESTIQLWHSMLKDYEFELVKASVLRYIATVKFPPAVADIIESIAKITTKQISADDAWGQVVSAIKKYGSYQCEKALESMDYDVAEIVKRIGFKELCISETPMVDRAHFLKIWESRARDRKEQAMIPQQLKNRLASLSEKFKQIEA